MIINNHWILFNKDNNFYNSSKFNIWGINSAGNNVKGFLKKVKKVIYYGLYNQNLKVSLLLFVHI